jgi:hypothetical protein
MAGNSSHDEYAWYVYALSLVNRVRMRKEVRIITRSNIFFTIFKVNWNSGSGVIFGFIAHCYDSTTNMQQCNSTSYNNKLYKEDLFQTFSCV